MVALASIRTLFDFLSACMASARGELGLMAEANEGELAGALSRSNIVEVRSLPSFSWSSSCTCSLSLSSSLSILELLSLSMLSLISRQRGDSRVRFLFKSVLAIVAPLSVASRNVKCDKTESGTGVCVRTSLVRLTEELSAFGVEVESVIL